MNYTLSVEVHIVCVLLMYSKTCYITLQENKETRNSVKKRVNGRWAAETKMKSKRGSDEEDKTQTESTELQKNSSGCDTPRPLFFDR